MKKYRFFYHYNKPNKKMSVHYRGQCLIVKDVLCNVPCETKWSESQPNLKMIGWASNVEIKNGIATIS